MINIDFTLFLQMIQFLIILVIGKKLIYDPVSATINSRNSKIQSLLKESENLKKEVAAYKKDYEEKLAAIKLEVAEYQKKMRDEAMSLANEMISKVKDEVDKKIAKARKDMEIQFETSKVALEAEAGALADLIVEKMIGNIH
jgi:F-type H+-transporting ATPase subunit b